MRRMVTGLAMLARPARRAAVNTMSASGFLRKGLELPGAGGDQGDDRGHGAGHGGGYPVVCAPTR